MKVSQRLIVIPIIFRSATVSVATREQDAPTLSLMVFIWNDYNLSFTCFSYESMSASIKPPIPLNLLGCV